jgi:hypothetical protein
MAHYAFSSSKHYALWEQYRPLQYRPGQRSLHLKRSGHNVMYAFSSFPPLRFMQTIPTNTHSAFRKQYSFSFLEPILITKLQETIPIDIVRGEAFKRTKKIKKHIVRLGGSTDGRIIVAIGPGHWLIALIDRYRYFDWSLPLAPMIRPIPLHQRNHTGREAAA